MADNEVLKLDSSAITRETMADNEVFEDVDEDAISDDEDTERSYRLYRRDGEEGEVDEIGEENQLLRFSDAVTKDVLKYFGKKKNDDWCDIYLDTWESSAKSGKHLYYSDLLKIAQGSTESAASPRGGSKNLKKRQIINDCENDPNVAEKIESLSSKSLGPLEDLFVPINSTVDVSSIPPDKTTINSANSRNTECEENKNQYVPMVKRKLPDSFWKEPEQQEPGAIGPMKKKCKSHKNVETGQLPHDSGSSQHQGPDFSDLLDSWPSYV